MEISHQFTRPRRDFGRPTRFIVESAQMLADIRPNEERAKMFVITTTKSTGVQAGPVMSEHEVSTDAVVMINKGMGHMEGGWPKDVDCTEPEQTARYIRKIEKDEHYIKTVVALCATAEEVVKQNNAIDIYEEYWADMDDASATDTEAASMSTIAHLKDPHGAAGGRGAQNVSWHRDGSHKVAVAFAMAGREGKGQDGGASHLDSYVWDLQDPNVPESTLTPTSFILSLHFSTKDPKVLGAGQCNGQFGIFDTRRGASPVEITPAERSHRDPIYDFAWLQSKTGTEAMTLSTDGRMLWWDTRRLAEPSDELLLQNTSTGGSFGATSISYNPSVGTTRYLVGTEEGCILSCNKAKGQGDRMSAVLEAHHSGICGLERNPFHPKYFLSCGDWTARVWNEDLRTPILSTPFMQAKPVSLCWSPSRPGVYFTARGDGALDVWDIMLQGQRKPIMSYQVTDDKLASIRSHFSGKLLASGCTRGAVHILSVGEPLVQALSSEKTLVLQTLEGETLREKTLDKAQKEAKVRARKAGAKSTFYQPSHGATSMDDTQIEGDFA